MRLMTKNLYPITLGIIVGFLFLLDFKSRFFTTFTASSNRPKVLNAVKERCNDEKRILESEPRNFSKSLVIIIGETRAHELTFEGFKRNVIDVLGADLCLCIGIKADYDYDNPFYKLAKHKFLHIETADAGDDLQYASDELMKNKSKYEQLRDINGTDDKNSSHWRESLKFSNQLMGGVKDERHPQVASGGRVIFLRWLLLKNLIDTDLINQYDRFIITRSDFIYQLPHPSMKILNDRFIWIPNGEHYGGYTDRHAILSKSNIESYLNIFNNMVLRSNEYFTKMENGKMSMDIVWNLEQLVKFNLKENNCIDLVKEFPYVMYSVRNVNGTTSWNYPGTWSEKLGYNIKYETEYNRSTFYKNCYEKSGLKIDEFYNKCNINIHKHRNIDFKKGLDQKHLW